MRLPGRLGGFVAASLVWLLVACSDRPLEPEPVPLDRVSCARCGMMVSREADSAEWIAAGEEPRFYDDIGCTAADDRLPAGRSARFVHVEGGHWAPAEAAFYARPVEASTPMGYGVVAFSTREAAAARDRAGRARTWDELIGELRSEKPGEGGRP